MISRFRYIGSYDSRDRHYEITDTELGCHRIDAEAFRGNLYYLFEFYHARSNLIENVLHWLYNPEHFDIHYDFSDRYDYLSRSLERKGYEKFSVYKESLLRQVEKMDLLL